MAGELVVVEGILSCCKWLKDYFTCCPDTREQWPTPCFGFEPRPFRHLKLQPEAEDELPPLVDDDDDDEEQYEAATNVMMPMATPAKMLPPYERKLQSAHPSSMTRCFVT